jgi:hypothetical protein
MANIEPNAAIAAGDDDDGLGGVARQDRLSFV